MNLLKNKFKIPILIPEIFGLYVLPYLWKWIPEGHHFVHFFQKFYSQMSILNCFFSCFSEKSSFSKWKNNEQQKVFLLDMPDLVMRQILKDFDFLTIQKLRMVCHALCDYIDDAELDHNFEYISISVWDDNIMGSVSLRSDLKYVIKSD